MFSVDFYSRRYCAVHIIKGISVQFCMWFFYSVYIQLMKRNIACTRKQQPRFYWRCSSVVMNDATQMTPLAHERNSIFKWKQHTCTLHDPWGPGKIWLHNMKVLLRSLHYQRNICSNCLWVFLFRVYKFVEI